MKRLKDELSIIGPGAWLIVFLVWLVLTAAMTALIGFHGKPYPPVWVRIWLTTGPPIFLTIYALLIAYVHADAKRRGMRHVMWTLLAALVPNGIGIILYFILREPMAGTCTNCGSIVRGNYAFCSKCGHALATACPQCRRPVETGWAACAYCGMKLTDTAA